MTWKITALLISLLLLLFYRMWEFSTSKENFSNGQQLRFQNRLSSETTIVYNAQRFSLYTPGGTRIHIVTGVFPRFSYADRLEVSGKVNVKMLNNKQTVMTMYFPTISLVEKEENMSLLPQDILLHSTQFVRERTISLFQSSLSKSHAGLLLGIVLGIKTDIPKADYDSYQKSGVLHVVAASGMNVSMVGAFLLSIFTLFLQRQTALIFVGLGILFYAFIAGLEPSIVRASIMGILVLAAQLFGRQQLALVSLLLTGYSMLFFDPRLISDIGFQLSFLATGGILFLKPIFESSQQVLKKGNMLSEDILTTFSAQLATLPVLMVSFQNYSLVSILTNTLVLWSVPFLMFLGGIAAILGFLFVPLAQVFLYVALPLLLYFQGIISFFSSIGPVVSVPDIPWQIVAGYYLIGISFIFYARNKAV